MKQIDRRAYYKQMYGITPEFKAELLTAQENRCAICRTVRPGGSGWHIDHDHTTNAVRGILCHACNVGIGFMADDCDRLRAAIDYLNNPPAVAVSAKLRRSDPQLRLAIGGKDRA